MTKYSLCIGITNNCNMNCNFYYSVERRTGLEVPKEKGIDFFDSNSDLIKDVNYGTDYHDDFSLGNINDESIIDIWSDDNPR